ncbi:MAG: hypothetical protein ACKOW9_04175 [Candidatus Paceibacterota bacterium]
MENFTAKPTKESDFYELSPNLVLTKEKADLSYRMHGETYERRVDLYKDEAGQTWFEITKSPRKQLAVALLSHSVFNTAPIGQVVSKTNKVEKHLLKFNPKVFAAIKPLTKFFDKNTTVFVSKGSPLENMEERNQNQICADYIIFCMIFSEDDRDINQRHNITVEGDSYKLYDFDNNYFVPQSHFEAEKALRKGLDYVDQIKDYLAPAPTKMSCSWNKEPLGAEILGSMFEKYKQLKEYFMGDNGKKFFAAAIKKSGYLEEYKESFEKCKKENLFYKNEVLDESYINIDDLYQGFLSRIEVIPNLIQSEIQKFPDFYKEKGLWVSKSS